MPTQAIETAFRNYQLLFSLDVEQKEILKAFMDLLKKIHAKAKRVIPVHDEGKLSFQVTDDSGSEKPANILFTLTFSPKRKAVIAGELEDVFLFDPREEAEVDSFLITFCF